MRASAALPVTEAVAPRRLAQRPASPLRLALASAVVIAAVAVLSVIAAREAERLALDELRARGQDQLGLYARSLNAVIDRYRALPALLALDPELRAVLAGPVDAETSARLSRRLEAANGAAGTSTLTVIDAAGIAVAANNWRLPSSNVGVDYRFRPYFEQALREGSGHFYGIGITTGVPGYFLAQAVEDAHGQRIGAVAVKVDLSGLEREWRSAAGLVLVSDRHGIVFLASRAPWRYRLLRPLDPAAQAELDRTQQYAGQRLQPLPGFPALDGAQAADGLHIRLSSEGLAGDYLWQALAVSAEGWTLHLLQSPAEAEQAGLIAGLAAGGGLLTLLFLGLFVQQRLRLATLQRRSREELEQLVRQHSEDLRDAQDRVVLAAERASVGHRQSLEHLAQGVSVIDAELRLTAWNRRYVEIFGYPAELVRVGRPIEDLLRYNARRGLLGSGNVEDAVQRRLEHLRAARPHTFEREWADGTVLEIRGNPLPGGGFVTSYADITAYRNAARELRTLAVSLERRVEARTRDLEAARREAERANQSKTRFVSAAVHDLLQPLNAARMYVAALRERLGAAPERALADNIDEALVAEDGILSSLLDIARLESGALAVTIEDVALQPLFDALRREFAPAAAAAGLELRVRPTRAIVRSDAALLRRILQNFLSNALRYTAAGRVLLGLRRCAGGVRIEVWDTGCGIAEAHRERVFEEFQRLDGGARLSDRGAGLGLAIVQRIARRLDHGIGLRSWPGRGSVFSLELPRGEARAIQAEPANEAASEGSLAGCRVWCLDDDSRMREATRVLLEGWGCTVRGLASVDLRVAEIAELPDVLLLDAPAIGAAVEWLSRLQPSGLRLPAVILIAAERDAAAAEAEARGWAFLAKPVRPPALRALMRQLRLRGAGELRS